MTHPCAPDKQRVQQRFEKALATYDQHAVAQQQINRRLLTMLLPHLSHQALSSVLEIGCGSGDLSRLLVDAVSAEQWLFNDLSPNCAGVLSTLPRTLTADFIAGDAEQLPPQFTEHRIELLASASTVQWFARPLDFVDHAATLLRPSGLLLFSTFLPDNLAEIQALRGNGLNYPTLADWQQRLATQFDVLTVDHEPIILRFDTPKAVLQHLKFTGVTATETPLKSHRDIKHFCQAYAANFADDNGVTLTYAPLLVLAKRRQTHPNRDPCNKAKIRNNGVKIT